MGKSRLLSSYLFIIRIKDDKDGKSVIQFNESYRCCSSLQGERTLNDGEYPLHNTEAICIGGPLAVILGGLRESNDPDIKSELVRLVDLLYNAGKKMQLDKNKETMNKLLGS